MVPSRSYCCIPATLVYCILRLMLSADCILGTINKRDNDHGYGYGCGYGSVSVFWICVCRSCNRVSNPKTTCYSGVLYGNYFIQSNFAHSNPVQSHSSLYLAHGTSRFRLGSIMRDNAMITGALIMSGVSF